MLDVYSTVYSGAHKYRITIIGMIAVFVICLCVQVFGQGSEPMKSEACSLQSEARYVLIVSNSTTQTRTPTGVFHSTRRPLFNETMGTKCELGNHIRSCLGKDCFTESTEQIHTDLSGETSHILGQNTPRLGSTDLAMFTPQELQYARWDCSLNSIVPGHGPELPIDSNSSWSWQWMPNGELYRSYFASNREARLGIHCVHEDKLNIEYWDPILGGKIALLRYGNKSKLYPEGFQLGIEGAALARLTLNYVRDLYGTDYRFALPLTWRKGQFEVKFGYYHISSHMGDEWIVNHYNATGEVFRRNYVRDCLMVGWAWHPDANWRFYVGGDYAFNTCEGAEPWQIEFGAEFSPTILPSFRGSPFTAIHFNWNEENNWETYVAFQAGWQWKTLYQQTFRLGLYTMAGHADQYQFYNRREKQIGVGMWYDF